MTHNTTAGQSITPVDAQHEAGHAVAAVFAEGTLLDVVFDPNGPAELGVIGTWRTNYIGVSHEKKPFVTFAGPWAHGKWVVENDPSEYLDEAIDDAWHWNEIDDDLEADAANYRGQLDKLGLWGDRQIVPTSRPWEKDYKNTLECLLQPIKEVATVMIMLNPAAVDHYVVDTIVTNHLAQHPTPFPTTP